jgi:hypothetical protein
MENNHGDLEVKRYFLFLYGWEFMSHESKEERVIQHAFKYSPTRGRVEAYEHLQKIVEVHSNEEVCIFPNQLEYCEKWKNLVENYGQNDLSTTILWAPLSFADGVSKSAFR